ncbi:PD-(D/E)XK nuclease family protein [Pseudomonas sp. BN411]|uniref:PDDEXK-like family protein n=1 Tax=Pseudomonas sp. BN411 TaxID=2567887 RepID=UPI002455DB81|nr:PD-(D/E)XK nuclease family protein [Pseudomonas sp. BN411]MDH4560648.1 hypothetical protein [Pseudomonas sp. BN411]
MDDFLHTVALLRAKHHRPAGFNLFSVLRSSSDEVRLHSRYLSFLLDPKGTHNKGTELLENFLATMGIENFNIENAAVDTEYQNIDILIRNTNREAVIIENKIYAGDQDEQIYRYYKRLVAEGYQKIWCIYLTLDGSEPSEQSKKSLEVVLASYETDIIDWLNLCIPLVAREPGVRESVFQYIELLQKLTSSDQGEIYMSKLKEQILQGENIFLIADIEHAFKEVLIDLQLDLWERMLKYQEQKYKRMPTADFSANKEAIRAYYNKSKNSKFYGIDYNFDFMEGGVYIQLNHRLYSGYTCNKETNPNDYNRLIALNEFLPTGTHNTKELYWKYPSKNLNYFSPTNEDLAILKSPEEREELARSLIDDAHQLWQLAKKHLA